MNTVEMTAFLNDPRRTTGDRREVKRISVVFTDRLSGNEALPSPRPVATGKTYLLSYYSICQTRTTLSPPAEAMSVPNGDHVKHSSVLV